MGRKRLCIGWTRLLISLPILVLITHLISVMYLRRETNVENMSRVKQKKFDHLVLGLAAGEGWPGRLQCQGNKALNKTHSGKDVKFKTVDRVAFVTVFAIYNTPEGRGPVDLVKVGNNSYNKMDRSMAILNVFINFIQVTMPQSNVIILTDPASEIPLHRDMVTIQTIQGEYSRDKLMLQRIRSYIVRAIEKQHILVILIPSELASYGHAFLESRLEKLTQNPEQVTHYIFTDSDIAVVDDLGHFFTENPNFDVALTFRNNKQQPLNSGFIAVRGTSEGIRRGKSFLQAVLEIYSSKFMKASRMLGDQLALAWVVTSQPNFNARKFSKGETFTEKIAGASVLFLPCSVYNWTPPEGAGQFHGMPLDVKVVHFKGSRKRLMLESWNYYLSTSDISDMLCLILRSGRTKYDF